MVNIFSGSPPAGQMSDAPLGRFLFRDGRAAWLWLVVRLVLGYEWLMGGVEKFGAAGWTGAHPGAAVIGFVQGAVHKAQGPQPDVTGWYATFLHSVILPQAPAVAYAITCGEILVGIGLIVGGLTGIAAFFGVLMNANYILSGTLHTNATMLFLGVLLMVAWRNAGWIGLDRWLLPLIGTPWAPAPREHPHSAAIVGS